jgi:hypothetical protein
VELTDYITVTVLGKTDKGDLNPKSIDISETREMLMDIENLFYPSKAQKEERPRISYEVQEGSVKNIFHLPLAEAIMFTALLTEVQVSNRIDFLDSKQSAVLDKWQRQAYESGRQYEISSSTSSGPFLTINKKTEFIAPQGNWVDTSLYLYGKIYEEGGLQKVNLHILTDRYGKVPVKATEEQLTSGENKLFKIYGLWVKGKQDVKTGELKNLELIDYLIYQPDYDELALKKSIEKASGNWRKIRDKDAWLRQIRGGVDE